ncbi:hypothetical protein [Mariniflexile sp.]|uniref:hypothetical protein n=1 Tax=Mariniflexile sp. TaxID=1979402 RepID=UPI0040471D37
MNKKMAFCWMVFFAFIIKANSQHTVSIKAKLDADNRTISIVQKVEYLNQSNDTLSEIHFHDWANSYSNKKTPLAIRFGEDYKRNFHFAHEDERGYTSIGAVRDSNKKLLDWVRYNNAEDILKVYLNKPLLPTESVQIEFNYCVKLPHEKFTGNGFTHDNDFYLRSWFIVPAVYSNRWETYSNKDLMDFYAPLASYEVDFEIPKSYTLTSGLKQTSFTNNNFNEVHLEGENYRDIRVYIQKATDYYTLKTNHFDMVTNIVGPSIGASKKLEIANKIVNYLEGHLGAFQMDRLLVSNIDERKNPIYGFNQLPEAIRPFSNDFQYEMQLLKTTTNEILERVFIINPREEKWITDGILIYLMMDYIDEYYPEMKLGGNFSKIFGLKWFHAVNLDFNDQYYLGYKNMARRFKDQSLSTPRDSLLKFNYNIANTYKAGLGFRYLDDYLNDNTIGNSIKTFYSSYKFKLSGTKDIKSIIESSSKKNINWFFNDYINSNEKIDFGFKSVKEDNDSLQITLKNRRHNLMPVSLYVLKNDTVINKIWLEGFLDEKRIAIPKNGAELLIIDYDENIPEVKRSNNYWNLKGVFNKPLQLRLLKDVEDPSKNQTFFMPVFEFNNIYDGLTLGGKLYNKTIIKKNFIYKFTPTYGFKSNALLGSILLSSTSQIKEAGWYAYNIEISGNRTSYAPNLFANSITPSIQLNYRSKDLRSNLFQNISLRSVSIFRDKDPLVPLETPDYSVLNATYRYSNSNFSNSIGFKADYELSKNFSKVSFTTSYRRLFDNNRQVSLRMYAGTFLKNKTQNDDGYFDFALDRPSDYLFDYNYLGRSEDTGLVSQEYITAEGGFKSILDTRFANQWLASVNAEVSIWNWIHAYGDIGYLKNKRINPYFAYDSGVKLSLVDDYFELYLPIASNNGFELGQDKYGDKIRFKVTLDIKTLIGLFTRRWY